MDPPSGNKYNNGDYSRFTPCGMAQYPPQGVIRSLTMPVSALKEPGVEKLNRLSHGLGFRTLGLGY